MTVGSCSLIQCNTVNILQHTTFKEGMAMFHLSSQTCATSLRVMMVCSTPTWRPFTSDTEKTFLTTCLA